MIDLNALIDTNTKIKKLARYLNDAIERSREMDSIVGSGSAAFKNLTRKQHVDLNALVDPDQIRGGRSLLEDALIEKASKAFVNECLSRETFPRCTYNAGRDKALFVIDIIGILDELSPPCCLAVYRASLEIGLTERFVPPATTIASKVRDQEAHLYSMFGQISSLENLRETIVSR